MLAVDPVATYKNLVAMARGGRDETGMVTYEPIPDEIQRMHKFTLQFGSSAEAVDAQLDLHDWLDRREIRADSTLDTHVMLLRDKPFYAEWMQSQSEPRANKSFVYSLPHQSQVVVLLTHADLMKLQNVLAAVQDKFL